VFSVLSAGSVERQQEVLVSSEDWSNIRRNTDEENEVSRSPKVGLPILGNLGVRKSDSQYPET